MSGQYPPPANPVSSRSCVGRGRWSAARATGVLTAVLVAGCASTHDQLVDFVRAGDAAISTGQYTVHPPDAVTIHAPGATEIDGVMQRVRPDGKLSLRLLGDVHVAGLTPEEIADKLKTQLARYYIEPEVVVEVAHPRSAVYYVFGEVSNPGVKPFTGRDTLLSALAEARPTFLAWRSQVRVVRPAPDAQAPRIIVVDLEQMLRSGDSKRNVLLQPGDIIEVPPTPLAWLGHRVRELLYPFMPAIEAYTRPTEVLEANDIYEEQGNGGNDGDVPGR